MPKGWNGIERLIKVRRWGLRSGKKFEQTAYYITSKLNNIALTLMKVKGWKTNADTFAKISNKIDELMKLFTKKEKQWTLPFGVVKKNAKPTSKELNNNSPTCNVGTQSTWHHLYLDFSVGTILSL